MGRKNKKLKRKKIKKMYIYNKAKNQMEDVKDINTGWEVKIDTITNCDKAPDEIIIWISPLVKTKIDALMEKYSNIEWLAYLIGENNYAKDLWIPKQRVTSVKVDDIECPEYNELMCIGVIHSHHGMGNGFSGTDHEWINQNHNISLCISNTGIAGQCRYILPCGGMKIVKVKVKIKYDIEFDKDSFIKMAEKNISEYSFHKGREVKPGIVRYYDGHGYKEYKGYNDIYNIPDNSLDNDNTLNEDDSLEKELKSLEDDLGGIEYCT